MTKQEIILNEIMPEIYEQAEVNNKSEIKLESTLKEDLKIDSLDAVELCMKLERKYTIHIPDGEFEEWKTVADVVETIINRKH